MTVRRSIVHALLSLLLLVSQQIGATHGYSHWSALQNAAAEVHQGERGDNRNSIRQLASDLSCAECLSLAQIAVAIGSPGLAFGISLVAYGPITLPQTLSACARTVCVFQSRAPPQA